MAELKVDIDSVAEGSAIEKQMKEGNDGGGAGAPPADKPSDKPADAPPPPADKASDKPADKPADKLTDAPPAFDKDKYTTELLKDIFGADVDIAKAKEAVSILPRVKSMADELEGYKKAPKVEFANDYVKGLNDYVKQGGNKDTYDKIQALDLDKLNGLDAIKALYKWDNPELTDAQIERKLSKKYSQSDDFSDEEKQDGQVDITIDSKSAKSKLAEIKTKYSVPDAERERVAGEESEKQRVAAWQPEVKKMLDGLSGIDLILEMEKDAEGKEKPSKVFNYKVTDPELKKQIASDLGEIIQAWDAPVNAETLSDLADVARQRVIIREFPNIQKAIWNEANTVLEKRYRDKYHVGEDPNRGDIPQGGSASDSNEDELYKKQVEYATGRRK